MITKYKARGLVYGKYWGGGEGIFKAVDLHGDDKELMLREAGENLGVLDDGMGFEEVLGAFYEIEKIETIKKQSNGLKYSRSEYQTAFLGDLTDEQKESLRDCV